MPDERNIPIDDCLLISRAAHVLDRLGLAMTGAMIGTFVAAQLAKTNVASFQTFGFVGLTVLSGIIGFYLRINTSQLPHTLNGLRSKVNAVEWLSAVGTFLATLAALVSVYALVFDEVLQRVWEFVVGASWALGVIMQTSAGLMSWSWISKPPA